MRGLPNLHEQVLLTLTLTLTLTRYAVYLGMEPKEDADLLWIAEEARRPYP